MKNIVLNLLFIFSFFALETTVLAKTTTKNNTLTVDEIISNGKYLKLSDGSYWEIEPGASPLIGSWLFAPSVTIEKSNDPTYPFSITNETSQTKVLAKKITQADIPTIMPPTQRSIKKQRPASSQEKVKPGIEKQTTPTPHEEKPKPQKKPLKMPTN